MTPVEPVEQSAPPEPSIGATRIHHQGVELAEDGVGEWNGERRAVFVPRDDIVDIELCHGMATERTVLHLVFAAAFIALGAAALRVVLGWWAMGGLLPAEIASGIALLPAGAYMAVRVFLPRHFLRVRARHGERKLVFQGKVDRAELAQVLKKAQMVHGYTVRSAIPGFDAPGVPYR